MPSSLELLETRPSARLGLYHTVWRWHFYAGLFVAPFLLVFAVTGGLYLFKPQIEGWLYHDLYQVPASAQTQTPDALLKRVLTTFPCSRAQAYTPPTEPTQSALVRIATGDGRKITVAINPHSGTVLGSVDDAQRLMQAVRDLHGKLLFGNIGQMIQELAASWAMVLIMTGLYLWWPRTGRHSASNSPTETLGGGTFIPRLNASGRVFWRDLHAVTGFWISGLLVFLIVTGLPWSVISGGLLHDAAGRLGKGSPDTGVGWDGGGSRWLKSRPMQRLQDRPVDQGWATDHAQELAGPGVSRIPPHLKPLSLEQIIHIAQRLPHVQPPFEIRMPVDAQGVFSIVADHHSTDPSKTAYVHLDQYTGKLIKEVGWKDFGPLAKAIALGVSIHEGHYFGWPNQLLGLAACLGLMVMVLTGLVMWWWRRPVGRLGIPPASADYRLSWIVLGLIAVLALLMPLMGASLLAILGGEWLARKIQQK